MLNRYLASLRLATDLMILPQAFHPTSVNLPYSVVVAQPPVAVVWNDQSKAEVPSRAASAADGAALLRFDSSQPSAARRSWYAAESSQLPPRNPSSMDGTQDMK
ncbi:hypothetical protein POX_b02741 [Penicillium oxalicum]|uniref:hypothetical protein n=1 Tax=Penicillium oxalicum TaxID=69781 RepID=UPI0020B7472E|nr:hypothetical protein POX_b02741 [Penicillium oxalicum]KAI2792700.1 hypothetical protein POX_b02741 [Penicillium oxalicum]